MAESSRVRSRWPRAPTDPTGKSERVAAERCSSGTVRSAPARQRGQKAYLRQRIDCRVWPCGHAGRVAGVLRRAHALILLPAVARGVDMPLPGVRLGPKKRAIYACIAPNLVAPGLGGTWETVTSRTKPESVCVVNSLAEDGLDRRGWAALGCTPGAGKDAIWSAPIETLHLVTEYTGFWR